MARVFIGEKRSGDLVGLGAEPMGWPRRWKSRTQKAPEVPQKWGEQQNILNQTLYFPDWLAPLSHGISREMICILEFVFEDGRTGKIDHITVISLLYITCMIYISICTWVVLSRCSRLVHTFGKTFWSVLSLLLVSCPCILPNWIW